MSELRNQEIAEKHHNTGEHRETADAQVYPGQHLGKSSTELGTSLCLIGADQIRAIVDQLDSIIVAWHALLVEVAHIASNEVCSLVPHVDGQSALNANKKLHAQLSIFAFYDTGSTYSMGGARRKVTWFMMVGLTKN